MAADGFLTDFAVVGEATENELGIASRGRIVVLVNAIGKSCHAISSALAPHMAKTQLLKDDGTLALINSEGDFLPGEYKRVEYAAADVPTKIFLNMGDALAELLEELHGEKRA